MVLITNNCGKYHLNLTVNRKYYSKTACVWNLTVTIKKGLKIFLYIFKGKAEREMQKLPWIYLSLENSTYYNFQHMNHCNSSLTTHSFIHNNLTPKWLSAKPTVLQRSQVYHFLRQHPISNCTPECLMYYFWLALDNFILWFCDLFK